MENKVDPKIAEVFTARGVKPEDVGPLANLVEGAHNEIAAHGIGKKEGPAR